MRGKKSRERERERKMRERLCFDACGRAVDNAAAQGKSNRTNPTKNVTMIKPICKKSAHVTNGEKARAQH
jgi:hypothetical protein